MPDADCVVPHPEAPAVRPALPFATTMAVIGWSALAVDFAQLLRRVIAMGGTIPEAIWFYLRFFTILTNAGTAALMTVTVLAIWRRRPLPSAGLYRAALVYMAVTAITYELLLRHLWSPQGLQFVTDLAFHDVQPALMLAFWVIAAPKRLGWRGLPWLLAYPAAYLAATLAAGAAGAGYPYPFLDAGRLGYAAVGVVGLAFLLVFLGLGALVTAAGRALTDGRSVADAPRSSSDTPRPAAAAWTPRR